MKPSFVKRLIAQGEGPKADFKLLLDLSSKVNQAEFAKDLMSLVNVSDSLGKRGYLLLGVEDDGTITGLQASLSHQKLQQAADNYCQPPVIFTYREVLVDGRLVGVITLPRSYRKPHKIKRQYGPDQDGRSYPEHTVYTRHLSQVVKASPEEVVALDREAEILRRKRALRIVAGLSSLFLCLLLIACPASVFALRSPAVQAMVTQFLPEGIPLLASGVDPKAAPLRQRDVEAALDRLGSLPSFGLEHSYVATLNGREDKAAEAILTGCDTDYHVTRTANFGHMPWDADRVEEYRLGDEVYSYLSGVRPEKWRVESASDWSTLPEIMRIAENNEIRLLGSAARGRTENNADRFYMLHRKGRVDSKLCDIYQARYQVLPGSIVMSSSLLPVESPTGGQAEEEAWIDQETGILLKYVGRLVFETEEGAEWEITITLHASDTAPSCPITLEIPEDAVIEEW